jgi:hypothetical protein
VRKVHLQTGTILLITIALGVFFIARPLKAYFPPQEEPMSFTVEGKITQHSGNKLTLNTEGNMVFRVVYTEKTTVTLKDGSTGSAKDLAVGTRIHVAGELTESGEIIAGKIKVQAEAGGK